MRFDFNGANFIQVNPYLILFEIINYINKFTTFAAITDIRINKTREQGINPMNVATKVFGQLLWEYYSQFPTIKTLPCDKFLRTLVCSLIINSLPK